MNAYAESSAVLAWLLGEDAGASVREELSRADLVVASDLTLVESDRAILRAATEGRITEADAGARRALLATLSARWVLLRMQGEVVERARRAFPVEPVRTLDALHLATAVLARGVVGELDVVSLDRRVRDCAAALGFPVLPAR